MKRKKKKTLEELKKELEMMSSQVYKSKKMAHILLKNKRNSIINPVEKRRKKENKHKNKKYENI